MKRFEGMDMEETRQTLQEVIDQNPQEFENMTPDDLLPFIEQKQYLASAMNEDIAECPEQAHVWSVTKQNNNSVCSVCTKKVDIGLDCSKCHQVRHKHEISHDSDLGSHCELINHYDDTNFRHIFSNKTLEGSCDTCHKKITRKHFGKVCRWCLKKIHFDCSSRFELCHSPKYEELIYKSKSRELNVSADRNLVPLLVFINPSVANVYGAKLFIQLLMILHPMQVIDLRVTNPLEGFKRFARIPNFTAMIIGGDRSFSCVMEAYYLEKGRMWKAPRFRFIPIGGTSELGKLFGETINYEDKSAEDIIKQLPNLQSFDAEPWSVTTESSNDQPGFCETFLFSFALGMGAYEKEEKGKGKNNSFWEGFLKAVTPARPRRGLVRFNRFRRSGRRMILRKNDGPALEGVVILKIDGEEIDLVEKRYIAIVFVNCLTPEDDSEWTREAKNRTTGEVEIYGITKYFKITRKNLMEKGTKLGQTSDVKLWVKGSMPFLADGYSGAIKEVGGQEMQEVKLTIQPFIKILVHKKQQPKKKDLLRKFFFKKNRQQTQDEEGNEECLAHLEKMLRQGPSGENASH